MKDHQFVGLHSKAGIRPAFVVAKFDLENTRCEALDNGSHLSSAQSARGKITNECNDVK